MQGPVIRIDPTQVTTRESRPHRLTEEIHVIPKLEREYLSPEAKLEYEKKLSWFLGQKEYLQLTRRDLARMEEYKAPDTYRNTRLTRDRLESQVKFMSLWFNEVRRWIPISQFKSGFIREIVINALNQYILTVPLPHYTVEQGLVTPFREIEIIIGAVEVFFKESHSY